MSTASPWRRAMAWVRCTLGPSSPVLETFEEVEHDAAPRAHCLVDQPLAVLVDLAGAADRSVGATQRQRDEPRLSAEAADQGALVDRHAARGVDGEMPPGRGQRHAAAGLFGGDQQGGERPAAGMEMRHRQGEQLAIGSRGGEDDRGAGRQAIEPGDLAPGLRRGGGKTGSGVAGKRRQRHPPPRGFGAEKAPLGDGGGGRGGKGDRPGTRPMAAAIGVEAGPGVDPQADVAAGLHQSLHRAQQRPAVAQGLAGGRRQCRLGARLMGGKMPPGFGQRRRRGRRRLAERGMVALISLERGEAGRAARRGQPGPGRLVRHRVEQPAQLQRMAHQEDALRLRPKRVRAQPDASALADLEGDAEPLVEEPLDVGRQQHQIRPLQDARQHPGIAAHLLEGQRAGYDLPFARSPTAPGGLLQHGFRSAGHRATRALARARLSPWRSTASTSASTSRSSVR